MSTLSPSHPHSRSPLPPRTSPTLREIPHLEDEGIHPQTDRFHPATAVTPKDAERGGVYRFNFPIIPIECHFYFKIYRQTACAENIAHHREFLENKSREVQIELEQLMTEFETSKHRTVGQYIKNSIEPLIDILEILNQKRLDNLVIK